MSHDHENTHHVNYLMIFGALCICTILSIFFDTLKNPALIVAGVLAIAVAKAAFVMTYFMHLKFEGMWKFIILMPTAILAVGLMVALAPDMAMHYYTYRVPQTETISTANGHGHDEPHAEGDQHKADHPTPHEPTH